MRVGGEEEDTANVWGEDKDTLQAFFHQQPIDGEAFDLCVWVCGCVGVSVEEKK